MKDVMFVISLSSMLVHELDAMRCKEWRIFPGLSKLSDKIGERVFILGHCFKKCVSFLDQGLIRDSNIITNCCKMSPQFGMG